MGQRVAANRKLNIHLANMFRGLDCYTDRGPLAVEYLEAIHDTIKWALAEHPRTLVVRFDLHAPGWFSSKMPDHVISRFFESLKSKINWDIRQKRKKGIRTRGCTLRYIWAREQSPLTPNCHYHVAIFLNRDTYHCLGHFKAQGGNLITKIREAWATALGIQKENLAGGVFVVKNPTLALRQSDENFHKTLNKLFYRLSYFAKLDSKTYGDHRSSFRTSCG